MKYKDSYKHIKKVRNKYGKVEKEVDLYEVSQKAIERKNRKIKNQFIKRLTQKDKHWVSTLSKREINELHADWWYYENNKVSDFFYYNQLDGLLVDVPYDNDEDCEAHYEANFERFVKDVKSRYGDLEKARELKLKELFHK